MAASSGATFRALAAAGYTAGEARPHSLHAYFLRPGDSSRPVLFRVDRLQDGRTFRRRRVTAIQQGQSPGGDLPRLTAGDIWFRFRAGPLPGTRSEVMITYLSDLTLAATTLRPTREHPAGRRDVVGLTSLDHSVWFHNEPDLSGWLLYAKDTPAVGGLRGLVGGRIFGQDGTLVASVAQEALVHVPKDQA